MVSDRQLRGELGAAVQGAGSALEVADRLCRACVGLLEADGASISARHGRPVLVADLDDSAETRWPAFTQAVLEEGVSAVFALPVSLSSLRVGALDLYRSRAGGLSEQALNGGLLAAELAVLPLLDMLAAHRKIVRHGEQDGWTQLASLDRVEVYQAAGMTIGSLDVDPTEALVRLRAYA